MSILNKIISFRYGLVSIIVLWRILLTVIVLASIRLPYQPTFPYATELLPKYGQRWLTTWAQFDGVHYLTIIKQGYQGTGLIQAFFPLYPLLIHWLSFGILNPIVIGVIISTSCFAAGLWWLYRLIRLDESHTIAIRTMVLILTMPVSFYFTSLYTEGLFFLLVVLSFYCARKQRWWWAGIYGALAASTRLVGIFLIPALLYEYYEQHKRITHGALPVLLPAAGLASFMAYLQSVFHDAFLFMHVQKDFGAGRSTEKFVLLHQVFYRYIKMFLTVPITSRLYYAVFQEFVAGLIGSLALIYGWFTTRKSYVIFTAGCFIVPTLTGTFSSLPRYILPLFPIYIVIAKSLPKWAYITTVIFQAFLLVINLVLFTQGLWVA